MADETKINLLTAMNISGTDYVVLVFVYEINAKRLCGRRAMYCAHRSNSRHGLNC